MSWETVALSDVAIIERIGVDPNLLQRETLYVGLENIEAGGRLLDIRPVSNGDLKSTKFAFGPGHILYGKLRPYLAKIALPSFEGICSTDILPILPGPNVNRNYLCHFLRQPSMVEFATSRSEGANLPRLSPKALADFRIPLPPLDEQKRIAAILDKADELRTKRRKAIALLDSLTQSIFLEMFGDPVSNPMGWDVSPLGEIAEFISGGTPSKSSPSYWTGSIPWVSPKDMKSVVISDAIDHISESAIRQSAAKQVPEDTILIVVRGMILAHTIPIAVLSRPAAFNQDIKGIRFKPNIELYFGLWNLLSLRSHILMEVASAAHGTKRIDMEVIAKLPVLLPPNSEQKRFKERCECVMRNQQLFAEAALKTNESFETLQSKLFSNGAIA